MLEHICGLHLPLFPCTSSETVTLPSSPKLPSQETKTHEKVSTFGQKFYWNLLMVVWGRKVNEVLKTKVSSSGSVYAPGGNVDRTSGGPC